MTRCVGTVASLIEGKYSEDGPVYPYLPVKDMMKPGLKPLKGGRKNR